MTAVRSAPCTACPYRRDAPSGLWASVEYDKLVLYDAPTGSQPPNAFSCHATPEAYCHGWALVHSNRDSSAQLLSLRLARAAGWWDGVMPEASVPLFTSGAEAAEHGKRDIDAPGPEAAAAAERLTRKYPRLEVG